MESGGKEITTLPKNAQKAVETVIAKATTKKNKEQSFTIDFEKCQGFIDQQIDLVPDETMCVNNAIIRHVVIKQHGETPIPQGEQVHSTKLKIRALEIAQLNVYRKSTVNKEAGKGAAGGAAGGGAYGALVGAAVGGVVPIIGNIIGALVGAAAGAGVGAGVGAGGGAIRGAVDDRRSKITLTAKEIFMEGEEYAEDKTKTGYITCVINNS